MTTKLSKEVGVWRTGMTVRGRIENIPDGDCFIIQLRDIDSTNKELKSDLRRIQSEGIPEWQFLQKGDVLFVAKGGNNFGITFNENIKAVASGVFFVFRPKKNIIIPEYFTWFINQSQSQAFLHRGKAGTSVTNINKAVLENLLIYIPPIDIQTKIARIDNLMQKEIFILEMISEKRRLFIQKSLLNKTNLI